MAKKVTTRKKFLCANPMEVFMRCPSCGGQEKYKASIKECPICKYPKVKLIMY